MGASGLAIDGGVTSVALLGLALSACLWWLYFGHGDDERAEAALAAMAPLPRARAALAAFFFCYLAMLLGIVAIAAAEHAALEHPFDELSWSRASLLSGGLALYLAGDSLFRLRLASGPVATRLAAAVVVVAAIPVGAVAAAAAQVAVAVVVLAAAIALDKVVSHH
jgi:low temperature requirement protein LtrA